MRYAILFLFLGGGLLSAAVIQRGWWGLCVWPATSVLLVGIGYAGAGSRVFGKASGGRHSLWALAIHFPYMLVTTIVWHLERWVLPENPVDRVADGLWVGRRPLRHEIPREIRWIVDLTAEFPVAYKVRDGRGYFCWPILDAHICDDRIFSQAVRIVAALEGDVYIHCAQGHGRSAAFAAAVMIARGLARNVDEAEQALVAARPKISLKSSQRNLVARVTPLLQNGEAQGTRRESEAALKGAT